MVKQNKPKYTEKFFAVARVLFEDERNEFLAKASLEDLKAIIPAELIGTYDLLPVSFNAFVSSLANLNGVVVDGEDTLKLYKKFIHRPINRQHTQAIPLGHIVSAALSKFNINYATGAGSELITEEEFAKDINNPTNVSLAGVIYRIADPDFANDLEKSADPEDETYMKYTASFEIGYDSYQILSGSNDIRKGEIIKDENEIERLAPMLKSKGGKGIDDKGNPIYLLAKGDIIPVGIGMVKRPAGLVRGIVTATEEVKDNNISSQKIEICVNKIDTEITQISRNKKMKKIDSIAQLKSLTQEDLKETCVASLRDVVENGIKEASDTYEKKIKEEENSKKEALEKAQASENKVKELEAKTKELETKIQEAQAKEDQRAKDEMFQRHMAYMSEKFELTEKQSEVVASEIKDKSDEDFKAWVARFELFAAKKAQTKEEKTKETATAEEKIETVLDTANESKEKMANTREADEKKAGLKKAFSIGQDGGIEFTK